MQTVRVINANNNQKQWRKISHFYYYLIHSVVKSPVDRTPAAGISFDTLPSLDYHTPDLQASPGQWDR